MTETMTMGHPMWRSFCEGLATLLETRNCAQQAVYRQRAVRRHAAIRR